MITYETLYNKFKNCNTKIVSEIDSKGNITGYKYKDILARVEEVASKLKEFNIGQNDNCVICASDEVDLVVYYLAIFKLNGVCILVDKDISEKELNSLLDGIDFSVFMTDAKRLEKFNKKAHLVININTDEYIVNKEIKEVKIDNDDAKTIIFSSGTTSSKSGIVHRTSNMYEMIKYTNDRYKCVEGDRFITIVPNSHIYGLSLNTIFCTYLATKVYYLNSLDVKILLKAFKEINPKYFCGVSKILELFETMIESKLNNRFIIWLVYLCFVIRKVMKINLGKKIFKKVFNIFGDVCLITAGSSLDLKTKNFLFGVGFKYIEFYGSTETGVPIICTSDMNKYTNGIGKLMVPSEIRIKEDTNELLVKNKYMLLGYIKNDKSINEILEEDGWINTGDMAKIVKDNIYIYGRTKEVIVLSNGEKVSPTDMEYFYKGIKGIEDYAIVGIPKDKNSICDEIHFFVVANEGYSEKEIRKSISNVSSTLSSNMRIKDIHFVEEIPKTSLGKTKRYLLKKMKDK